MRLHRQRLFIGLHYGPFSLRQRILLWAIRKRWPWAQCEWAGLGRRCPYYDCDVHGAKNRAPLVEAEKRRREAYIKVLDRTDGVTSDVLTPELFDRACALMYLDGDPR